MEKDSQSKIDLSLVLACYNEGSTLFTSLQQIENVLKKSLCVYEIICIDDCSVDETHKTLKKFGRNKSSVKIFRHDRNVGRGGTVVEGIKNANGEVVGYVDVDLEISANYIPDFVECVYNDFDVLIGNRIYQAEMNFNSILRSIVSRTYAMFSQVVLGHSFRDTEAGYKFFNRNKVLPVLEQVVDKGWFFDTEIVVRSIKSGLRVGQIDVIFKRRTDKKSTVKLFKDTFSYMKALLSYKFN